MIENRTYNRTELVAASSSKQKESIDSLAG